MLHASVLQLGSLMVRLKWPLCIFNCSAWPFVPATCEHHEARVRGFCPAKGFCKRVSTGSCGMVIEQVSKLLLTCQKQAGWAMPFVKPEIVPIWMCKNVHVGSSKHAWRPSNLVFLWSFQNKSCWNGALFSNVRMQVSKSCHCE